MRIAELNAVQTFRVVEGPIADPGPGEIQVAVQAVGICGSDLHAYTEGGVGDSPCVYPMVLGHEPAGVVAQVGPGVTGWTRGDKAALEPAHFCYHCEHCLAGRHNICARLRFLSTPGHAGFFRERVNLPVANLLALPAELPVTAGALVEPLAVVLHALGMAPPVPGQTAVVLGGGPIGLLTIAALKRAGCGRVWATEPVASRRALAKAMGADVAMDVRDGEVLRTVAADTGGRGVDLVFDCAAKGDTADEALQLAAAGGRVVFTGIASETRVAMDVHLWRRKELAVHQVRRSNHEAAAARDWVVRAHGFFAPLITHERPLEAIGDAFALCASYQEGVGKLIIRM